MSDITSPDSSSPDTPTCPEARLKLTSQPMKTYGSVVTGLSTLINGAIAPIHALHDEINEQRVKKIKTQLSFLYLALSSADASPTRDALIEKQVIAFENFLKESGAVKEQAGLLAETAKQELIGLIKHMRSTGSSLGQV